MEHTISETSQRRRAAASGAAAAILALLWVAGVIETAAQGAKLPVVPKWHRFEAVLKSSFSYTNPLQEATLTARFSSPLGDSYTVLGFWDGGRTWRVRFAPDQPGEWHFEINCSDAANSGLHVSNGAFLCTAALGESRFDQHGPVRVARDHRHLEHADGTPFFWLSDTVWNGARVSEPKEWEIYAEIRASQGFNVAQWAAAPGEDFKNESALTGFPDQVGVNPEVFRRLDAKLDTLSHEGILSAIVPLLETETNAASLREDQAALLVKYVVARWGAEPVVWLLTLDGAAPRNGPARWKSIGQAAFKEGYHAPLIACVPTRLSALSALSEESWIGVFGVSTLAGSVTGMWTNGLPRPLLAFTPYENAPARGEQKRFRAEDVRLAAYRGLLMAPPAGVSYGGQGVVNWDRTTDAAKDKTPGADLPLWQKALFMPAAKQMGHLHNFFSSLQFWRLRPEPKAVANQPGDAEPRREVLAAGTERKDLLLVYVPEDRTVELYLDAMPASPTVTWVNPRTGETSPAVAVVVGRTCQFPTPEPGDWLLVLRAGK